MSAFYVMPDVNVGKALDERDLLQAFIAGARYGEKFTQGQTVKTHGEAFEAWQERGRKPHD